GHPVSQGRRCGPQRGLHGHQVHEEGWHACQVAREVVRRKAGAGLVDRHGGAGSWSSRHPGLRCHCRHAEVLMSILDVAALHKSYGANPVLKGIDLKVGQNELVFIIGPSGSGKSTLLRCCNRLEEPDSGSVLVDGTDILRPGVDLNRLRQKIGMVFQSVNLYLHMTALGNVTLALRKVQKLGREEADRKGKAALARVGLSDKYASYPNELSGGQQQRVGIARSLALEPLIVLFDEPTSALDPELVGGV